MSMELKYIMVQLSYPETRIHFPFLFFDPITHIGMWEMVHHSHELPDRAQLVSAGFVRLQFGSTGFEVTTHGNSQSLLDRKLPYKPLPTDAQTIRMFNYLKGIQ